VILIKIHIRFESISLPNTPPTNLVAFEYSPREYKYLYNLLKRLGLVIRRTKSPFMEVNFPIAYFQEKNPELSDYILRRDPLRVNTYRDDINDVLIFGVKTNVAIFRVVPKQSNEGVRSTPYFSIVARPPNEVRGFILNIKHAYDIIFRDFPTHVYDIIFENPSEFSEYANELKSELERVGIRVKTRGGTH
jgi:hypothetical protein